MSTLRLFCFLLPSEPSTLFTGPLLSYLSSLKINFPYISNILSAFLPRAEASLSPPWIALSTQSTHGFLSSRASVNINRLRRGVPYPPTSRLHGTKARHLSPSAHLSASCLPSETVPELMFHFAWPWLSHCTIRNLCIASPVMSPYARLRSEALALTGNDIMHIRSPLDFSKDVSIILMQRARDISKLLLLCDFDFGHFQRFMGGIYTGNFLDFDAIDAAILELRSVPHVPGLPIQDFDRISHSLHHGFPIKHHFQSPRSHCLQRNLYDNHTSIDGYEEILASKVATDVQNSFACAFPRWILRFIHGLTLNAMGIDIKQANGKLKHRLINDPSTPVLGPHDRGNVNMQLDKRDDDHVPSVHYGDANRRIWERIYNLRLRYPDDEIIIYKDDIVAAFRRGKYHPDIAVAYAYVFGSFLVIPIGGLFGPRDTPGWFCMTSEFRAMASLHLPGMSTASHPLTDECVFDAPPSTVPLAKAIACSQNTGNAISPGPQTCFVDDTIIIEYARNIRASAAASILSAMLLYGLPPDVQHPISIQKYMPFFRHYCDSLGIDVDCRLLLVIYPKTKRVAFGMILHRYNWRRGLLVPVHILASILGKIRHAGQVIPLGEFLSFFLQENLNKHITLHPSAIAAWSKFRCIRISANSAHAILILQDLLSRDICNVWERPMGLLIRRDPTFVPYSDACPHGLGGYCFLLAFQWRQLTGVYSLTPAISDLDLPTTDDIHINIFEFIAIIINLFFSILRMQEKDTRAQYLTSNGYIIHAMSDNTSALSWMRHASRSRAAPIRNLALFLVTFLFHSNSVIPLSTHGLHVPGKCNDFADALSRPQIFPSYNDVWTRYEALRPLPCYRVPRQLTAMINSCLSQKLIPVPSEQEMKTLLSIRLSSLKLSVHT